MPWYVFALVDEPPAGRPGSGLSGPLALRPAAGAYAVVERRADVPPAEFGTLRRHHDVVMKLAERVPAILPVRFGTLLDSDALEAALAERDEDLTAAFDVVRGRVQFTWRRHAPGTKPAAAVSKASARSRREPGQEDPLTGTEYLRRAARASRPVPPAIWRTLRARLRPLVAAERYQAAAGKLPDSLYHLVDRGASLRYTTVAAALRHANPVLTMTGPWPAFAFAADIL